MVGRDDPGDLGQHSVGVEWRTVRRLDDPDVEMVIVLPDLDADLAVVRAVDAEGHPQHAVEAGLVAVSEVHRGHRRQVEWSGDAGCDDGSAAVIAIDEASA